MSSISRICVSLASLLLISSVSCMDAPTTPPNNPTAQIYPPIKRAQQNLPAHSPVTLNTSAEPVSTLYSSEISSWSFRPLSMIGSLISSAAGLASSATATVQNIVSDDAALKKIGFPNNDLYARDELTKCQHIYSEVLTIQNPATLKETLDRIFRRTEYLTRIFNTLPDRPDFDQIIVHCTNYHQQAMTPTLKNWYEKFLKEKFTLYNQLSKEIKLNNSGQKAKLAMSEQPQVIDHHELIITIPTLSEAAQYLLDSANSLYQTTQNELSDNAAFKKLGWPRDDAQAQNEQKKTIEKYDQALHTTTREDRAAYLSFILRRTSYVVRAFLSLPGRADQYQLAQHLILHHRDAMFPLLLTLFNNFITNQHKTLQLINEKMLRNSDNPTRDTIEFRFGTSSDTSIEEVKSSLGSDSLILLKQEHSTNGCVITEENCRMQMLCQIGDFLVTNKPGVRLGIVTADCLPIIFNDKKNNAIGIAHAGWQGSVSNIAKAVLECMNRNYGTKPEDLSIVFGPRIGLCCYSVQKNVIDRVAEHKLVEKTILTRENVHFFDLLTFNKELLIALGIKENAIDSTQSICTSCNTQYHSHRRQGDQAGRQLNLVWINNK